MKNLYLLFFALLVYSCNQANKQPHKAADVKPILKDNIIGDWYPGEGHPGIDTANARDFPDIDIEAKLSFYNDGRFKITDRYYNDNGEQKKIAGYTSTYKVKGDTLFIYQPFIKHWYKLFATMSTKDKMEIGSCDGCSHFDNHWYFGRVKK